MRGSRFLVLGVLVTANLSAMSRLVDPTSDAANKEEERFIASIEKRLKQPTNSSPTSSPAQATVAAAKTPTPQRAFVATSVSQPSEEVSSCSTPKTQEPSKKSGFSGFFCGLGGGMNHLYSKAELYSIAWAQLGDRVPTTSNSFQYIGNGSFAYNNNTWLVQGQAFIGYDIPFQKWLRLGLEIQGGRGWRSFEIASCGVFAYPTECTVNGTEYDAERELNFGSTTVPNNVKNGLTEIVIPEGEDIAYAYTRPTVQLPYNWSLLPRLGVLVSPSTFLYAKFGLKFENMTITDHPETIDVGCQYYPKKTADKIYDKTKATWIGGLGVETNITQKIFLRIEYYCSGGQKVNLEEGQIPKNSKQSATADNRQLDMLKLSEVKNFQFGLGAGLRF